MFLPFAVLFLSIQIAVSANNDILFQRKDNGGFRECAEYRFDYVLGEIDYDSKRLISVEQFDEYGNMIEYNEYD